jgi:hypothetical protein
MEIPDFLNSKSVLAYAKAQGLYEALVVQVKKDFTRVNLELDLNKGTRPEELQVLIREKLYFLLMERFSEYLNLMYAVDIPERVFKDLKITDTVDVAEQVMLLILKRELQKVILRERYRSSH